MVLALTTPTRRIVIIPVAAIIGEVPLAAQTRLRLGAGRGEVGGLALGAIFRSLALVNTVIYGVVEFVVIFVGEAIKGFEPEFLYRSSVKLNVGKRWWGFTNNEVVSHGC